MVKHIDGQKIEQAAGCQSVVHSYSGAKVEQINAKIKEYWSENDKYDTVILHVGTNNLVSVEPEEVAAKMGWAYQRPERQRQENCSLKCRKKV